MSDCPDALFGAHGVPNTMGKCPYCGELLGPRGSARIRVRRSQLLLRNQELLGERFYERDSQGGRVIPVWQDPEIDPDPDDHIYD